MQYLSNQMEATADRDIIQGILDGNAALFEILIRRYNQVLYKIARSYGFSHQDAEDLMQDTHVAAYLSLGRFEFRASYKTWISRIMINKCLYRLKYGKDRNEIAADQAQHQPEAEVQNNQTENTILNRELALILEKSIQELPLLYRTVFVLREIEGFSVAETAELLGITSINVKVRLNRARTLLQKQMEQFYSRKEIYSFNLCYCDAIVEKVFSRIRS